MDHEDEDLESFIANRRCGPKVANQEKGAEEYRDFDDTPRHRRGTPRINDDWIASGPFSQVRAECSATPGGAKNGSPGYRRRSLSMMDEFEPLIDFSNTGDHLDRDWRMKTPALELAVGCGSPLFVPQEQSTAPAARARSPRPLSRLIPIEYDSDSSESEAAIVGGRLHNVRQSLSNDHNHATRDITMKDAFAKPDYVNKIRRNPYTSGIFAYEDALDARKLAARGKSQPSLRLSTRSNNQVTDTRRSERRNRVQKTNEESEKAVFSRQPHQPTSTISKRKIQQTTNEADGAIGSLATGMIRHQGVHQDGHVHQSTSARRPKSVTPIATGSVDSPNRNKREILEYLKSQYQTYNTVLTELGSNHRRNEEHMLELEAQIQPEYDVFAGELDGTGTTNVGNLKTALGNWDMDIGVRALMQKRLMYHKLLQTISS